MQCIAVVHCSVAVSIAPDHATVLLCFTIASLVRTFMFLGFIPVAPGSHQLAVSGDLMYLAYTIQSDDDDDSSSDADDSD